MAPDQRALLVLHSNDREAGHREQLWWQPLDGGAPVALSAPAAKVRGPAWAGPAAVVYASDAQSFSDLYRAAPGQDPVRLTASPHGCFEPSVGAGLVVHTCSGATDPELWVVSLAGGDHRQLLARPGEDLAPAVSPDGRQVAFLGGGDGRLALWTVGIDGTGARRRWQSPVEGERVVPSQGLAWAPGGGRLALVVRDGDGAPGIRVVDLAKDAVVLSIPGEFPAWTGDGRLTFTHEDGGGLGVFRLDDPGGAVRLTAPGGWLGRPL